MSQGPEDHGRHGDFLASLRGMPGTTSLAGLFPSVALWSASHHATTT